MSSPTRETPRGWKRILPWVWGGIAVAVAVLAAFAVHALIPGGGSANLDASQRLFIPPERLDFGTAWEQKEFVWTLPITNCGWRDVEIESFSATCNCTKIEPRSLMIPAGQTRDVRLTIDLTPKPGADQSTPEERRFELEVWPNVRGTASARSGEKWLLRGTVRPLLRLEAAAVDFGQRSDAEAAFSSRRVGVVSAVPLAALTATSALPCLRTVIDRPDPDDPKQFVVEMAIADQSSPGTVQGIVTLTAQLDTGERVTKSIGVSARTVRDCQASPPSVLLGVREVGDVVEESVTLISVTRRTLELVDIQVEGEGLSGREVPVAVEGQGPTILFRQPICRTGENAAKARIRVRPLGGEVVEVVVTVSYHGLEP